MVKAIYQDLSFELEKYIRDKKFSGKIPGILRLCREFKVHHVTLLKAMRLLEQRGVVIIKGTSGTFIVDKKQPPRTNIIGVVGINSTIDSQRIFLDSLNEYVRKRNYNVIGINFQEKLFRQNKRILLNFPVDGFVFRVSSLLDEQLNIFQNKNIPIATCNHVKNCPWLNMCGLDHRHGYRLILSRLISMGHTKIAFVDFSRNKEYFYFISDIRKIFIDTLKHNFNKNFFYASITGNEALQIFGENYVEKYAHAALKKILCSNERPSAIIGPDGLMFAIGKELEKMKIRVPDDISLCCSSYVENERFNNLCGIRHSLNKSLKWALNNVIDQIEGKCQEPKTYFQKAVWHNGSSCSINSKN